jgi:iron complex outermembrane recepter protein
VLSSLNLTWALDNVTLTSVTGFYYYDYFRFDNFDQTVYWQLGGMQIEDHRALTQEFRAHTTLDGPVNFMGGVYLETFERDSDNRGKIAPVGTDPVTGFSNNWEGISTVESDSWSAFAQVTWDITPEIEFAGGVRYSEEDRSAIQFNSYAHVFLSGAVLRSPDLPPLESVFKDENWSPEATLTWRPQDDLTLFVAYRTGYKAGGFSTNTVLTPIATAENVVFEAEKAEGFEIGMKSRLLERRMLLNVTLYDYEFDDLQVSAFDPATTSFRIENAATATTRGIELDTEYLATDWLTLRGQVGYNEGEYDHFPGAPCWAGQTPAEGCVNRVQDLSGSRTSFAPKWNGSVGFSTLNALEGTGWSVGVASDLIYYDDIATQTADNPFSRQDSFWRWNLRASLTSDDGRWEFTAIGKNLTNERYVGGTADKPGGIRGDVQAQAIRPRQVLLQTTYRFAQ